MSNALDRVFALQEAKRKENEEAARKIRERKQREVAAFNTSPVMQMFREFMLLPVKRGFACNPRQFQQLLAYSNRDDTLAGKLSELVMRMSSGSTIKWSCYEDRDSGRMLYIHHKGDLMLCHDDTPDKAFTDTFLQFAADVLDPDAVTQNRGGPESAQPKQPQQRRILQVS